MKPNRRDSEDYYLYTNRSNDPNRSKYIISNSNCPLNRDALGRAGWAFLHSMAAFYPQYPTKEEKIGVLEFLYLFAKFYPCQMCGNHFLDEMNRSPPDVSSNLGLMQWMCNMHNNVNRRLGKGIYDCGRAMERWRFGWNDGSCSKGK